MYERGSDTETYAFTKRKGFSCSCRLRTSRVLARHRSPFRLRPLRQRSRPNWRRDSSEIGAQTELTNSPLRFRKRGGCAREGPGGQARYPGAKVARAPPGACWDRTCPVPVGIPIGSRPITQGTASQSLISVSRPPRPGHHTQAPGRQLVPRVGRHHCTYQPTPESRSMASCNNGRNRSCERDTLRCSSQRFRRM